MHTRLSILYSLFAANRLYSIRCSVFLSRPSPHSPIFHRQFRKIPTIEFLFFFFFFFLAPSEKFEDAKAREIRRWFFFSFVPSPNFLLFQAFEKNLRKFCDDTDDTFLAMKVEIYRGKSEELVKMYAKFKKVNCTRNSKFRF